MCAPLSQFIQNGTRARCDHNESGGWERHHVERMTAEWNKKHTQDGAQIERLDNKERFRVKLNFQKIENFDEAYRNMEISQAREMYMPCIMQTAPQDHKLHAVALTSCIEEGKMELP